jgi:hypothetical protein
MPLITLATTPFEGQRHDLNTPVRPIKTSQYFEEKTP